MSNIHYSWEFDDTKNRGSLWYIIALAFVIGLSIWGFLTSQYGMSFVILLIAGITYFIENNSDDIIKVEISDLGIKIANSFYDYKSITSFGIVYKGEKAILVRLNLIKRGIKTIDLKIDNSNVLDIKNTLSQFIEESAKIELSFLEKIIKLLKL